MSSFESPIGVPSRRRLLIVTLIMVVLQSLLVSWIVSRVLGVAGQGLSLSAVLLIGISLLVCGCLMAMLLFQHLQLPLEEAVALIEEQAWRIEALEAEAAVATARPASASQAGTR